MKRTGARADYEDIAEEIYCLREDKQKLQLESAGRDEQKKCITDMGTFLPRTAHHPDRIRRAACPAPD